MLYFYLRSSFYFFLILNLLFSKNLYALTIPQNLSQADRIQLTQILGHSTSTKLLSSPFPLGGYSGLEFGIAYTQLNTENIAHLGNTAPTESQFAYQKVSISKGLYKNFDISINFALPIGNTNMSSYGGFLKWGIYQGSYLPFYLSFLIHASTSTIEDRISSTTLGGELVFGLTTHKHSLYFGFGPIKTKSDFLGGANSFFLTDTGQAESELERTTHTFMGLIYNLEPLFFNFQMDRYNHTTLSFKIGARL